MDKINKALIKLPDAERKKLMHAFEKILLGKAAGLDVKKLKGHKEVFRLRVGDNRLMYQVRPGKQPIILCVGKRDDQTYRDF